MEPGVKTWRGCWRASDPKEDIREAVCLENEKDAQHLFGK
jgi:hypothetical protein